MNGRWSDEVLIPSANSIAYELVYEAETWLRRVVLAASLLSAGPSWAEGLPASFRQRLQSQSAKNASRWCLGIDAEEELLWSTTLGQLAQLLEQASLAESLSALCDASGEMLAGRVRSMAEIRNALAHNRALSEDSLRYARTAQADDARFRKSTHPADMCPSRRNQPSIVPPVSTPVHPDRRLLVPTVFPG